MRISTAAYLALLLQTKSTSAVVTIEDAKACNADVPEVDFLVLEGDANAEAIEDEVRTDLEKIGFKVKTRLLKKNDYNQVRKFFHRAPVISNVYDVYIYCLHQLMRNND